MSYLAEAELEAELRAMDEKDIERWEWWTGEVCVIARIHLNNYAREGTKMYRIYSKCQNDQTIIHATSMSAAMKIGQQYIGGDFTLAPYTKK